MLNLFKSYQQDLSYEGVRIPENVVDTATKKSLGLNEDSTSLEVLTQLCRNGYKEKNIKEEPDKDIYLARIKHELEILDKTGLVDYILIVHSLMQWLDENKIPRSWGRGSIGGVLCAYLIGLCAINPIKENLLFTRFINASRAGTKTINGIKYLTGNVGDIDSDVSLRYREKIVSHIKEIYPNRVCRVITHNTFTSKSSVKEVAKTAFNFEESEIRPITSLIDSLFGKNETIDETIENNTEFGIWANNNKELIQISRKLCGLSKNLGSNASALALTVEPLESTFPVQLDDEGQIISSFSKDIIEGICIKLDILSIKTIDIIYECANDVGYDLKKFDPYDKSIYLHLQKLKQFPYGIFQLEGDSTLEIFDEVRPSDFSQICAVSAISRPGARAFIKEYIDYVRNGKYKKLYEPIDNILKSTGGIILYQEQVMEVVHKVFMFNELEADDVRRCVGKKKIEDIKLWEKKLFDRGKELNIPENVTEEFWSTVKASANYLFSLNHDANYSYISLLTAFLKFNYPIHFYKVSLGLEQYDGKLHEVIGDIKRELDLLSIKLLPPKLNKSSLDISIDKEQNSIILGLNSLRGFSTATLEKLPQFINTDNFSDKFKVFTAAKQASVNIAALCNLISAGCLDGFGVSRQKLVLEAKVYNLLTDKEKIKINEMGEKYNYDLFKILVDIKEGKLKDIMSLKGSEKRKSRFENFYSQYSEKKKEYLQSIKNPEFDNYCAEVRVLGYSFSNNLKDIFKSKYKELQNIKEIKNISNSNSGGGKVCFCAIIDDMYYGKTKKEGKTYLRLNLSDEAGNITAFLGEEHLSGINKYEKGCIVFCRGEKKKNDSISLTNCTILANP